MTSSNTERPDTIPLSELLGPLPAPDVREVRAVAISSLSGSSVVGGNTQQMGNETDTELFLGARLWSDVVLVGAGTVREENYGGVVVPDAVRTEREARGQAPIPRMAILSQTFSLNPAMRVFTEATTPPLILAPHHAIIDPELTPLRVELEHAGAEIVDCGDGGADGIIETLHRHGFNRIDCEGGPTIFGEMFAAQLIDVFHLTIEPFLSSHIERALLDVPEPAVPFTRHLELAHTAVTSDSTLFLRYLRRK